MGTVISPGGKDRELGTRKNDRIEKERDKTNMVKVVEVVCLPRMSNSRPMGRVEKPKCLN